MKADSIYSTKRMTTQSYSWNLQRLQHSRNNSAATLNAAYYGLDSWVEKWDVSHISRVTFRPIIARSSSTVARPSDHSSWQYAEQETVWLNLAAVSTRWRKKNWTKWPCSVSRKSAKHFSGWRSKSTTSLCRGFESLQLVVQFRLQQSYNNPQQIEVMEFQYNSARLLTSFSVHAP